MKEMWTPLICGTVVRNKNQQEKFNEKEAITNLTFDRKLRMMRADIFALLSISTNSDFIGNADYS